MQENQDALQLLEKMAADNEAQSRYLKKQLFYTKIFAGACCILTLVLLVALLQVVPPLLNTLNAATETLKMVDDTLMDIQSLFEEDGLLGQGSEALVQATEKLSMMDIESLNKAIEDLGAVVEPLADFFDRFK